MAYCFNCGKEIESGSKFCTECGTQIESDANMASQQPQYTPEDIAENKAIALFSYISLLVLIPILAGRNSKFARFHANQGLILFLLSLAGSICGILPIIGTIVMLVVNVTVLVLQIIGIINVIKGDAKELPLIGQYKIF